MAVDVCNDAIRMALEETMRKCQARDLDEVVGGLKDGNECFHGYFRFYMMAHVLTCLASRIRGLRAVYMFGSTVDGSCNIRSDINLILYVSKKDPKMKRTLEDINGVLTANYTELLGLKMSPSFRLLDLHYVTDKEIKTRTGDAAMMGSVHDPPMLVWRANKGVCKL